jgi:hypothetical protein
MVKWRGTGGVVAFYRECEPLHGELGVCKGEKESGGTRLAGGWRYRESRPQHTFWNEVAVRGAWKRMGTERSRRSLPGARVNVCENGVDWALQARVW